MPNSNTTIAASFRTYAFFDTFTDQLISQVADFAKRVEYPAGKVILQQGHLNNLLFFLESGSVEIQLDNERVAALETRGEVVGEMSVISKLPVSATAFSKSDCVFYVINVEDFTKVSAKDHDHFMFLLHKIYSVVVTERLRSTNQKARDFEITNRELLSAKKELESLNTHLEQLVEERTAELKASYAQLEQKSAALSAGYKKVTDLSKFRDEAVKRIKDIVDIHVGPINKSLGKIQNKANTPVEGLKEANSEVEKLKESISRLVDWESAEKAMEQKNVLLVDADKKQQLVAKMALGGTGVTLEIAEDPEIAINSLAEKKYDLIFCSTPHAELLSNAHQKKFPGQMVLFTSNEVQSYLPVLKGLPFVENVVSRDPNDRTFTVKNIVTTITKLLNEDYFGLEKYLAWGVDVRQIDINHSNQRADQITKMQEYLKTLGIRNSIIDRAGVCAEEMLMNAVYDAPTDADGNSLFNHLPRTIEITLSKEQSCQLRYACDGNLVAISVLDPFGALAKNHVIEYLESCYQGEAGKFNKNKGGAGRGLHQIIENADLTIFNVKKGVRTEVIAIYNIDSSSKKGESQPTFHYFFN